MSGEDSERERLHVCRPGAGSADRLLARRSYTVRRELNMQCLAIEDDTDTARYISKGLREAGYTS